MYAFRIARFPVVAVIVAGALSACAADHDALRLETHEELTTQSLLPVERPLEMGKRHYRNGDYGLAEQQFRKAVEADKSDTEAWLGLAASYDRLRRFDHAHRAYQVLIGMVGNTPTVLNNLGYHYMLRGDKEKARATLIAASKADPGNAIIQNNLELLSKASTGG